MDIAVTTSAGAPEVVNTDRLDKQPKYAGAGKRKSREEKRKLRLSMDMEEKPDEPRQSPVTMESGLEKQARSGAG